MLIIALLAACASTPDRPVISFDACQPLRVSAAGASADQAAGLDDAISMWHAIGVTGVARDDAAADLTVVFESAAPAFHGYYDDQDAAIDINEDLDDPVERAITIAHELGHAYGLVHVEPAQRVSVMNPGNLTVAPVLRDREAIDALWGACR